MHNDYLESYKVNSTEYQPLVSLIIAVYNAEKHLEQCILSVLKQGYRNFEFIIIDGASTDGSIAIIEKYQQELTYWITEPDEGIYDAWNKGLDIATGDWVAFVGADDVLHPDAFQSYINHISVQPNLYDLEFVSSQIELVADDLRPIRRVGSQWEWDRFRVSMITWHVGCFHSRRLFDAYGIFDSSYKVSGDYELLLRPQRHLITSFVPSVLAYMRTGGVSHKRLYQATEETYRAKVVNKVISPFRGFILTYLDKGRIYIRGITGWKWL